MPLAMFGRPFNRLLLLNNYNFDTSNISSHCKKKLDLFASFTKIHKDTYLYLERILLSAGKEVKLKNICNYLDKYFVFKFIAANEYF